MGPYVCVAESLHYSPESITTLLIGCVCVCARVCTRVCARARVCVHTCMLGHVRLFATPWMVARQASLSMGLSRKNTGVGTPQYKVKFFLNW